MCGIQYLIKYDFKSTPMKFPFETIVLPPDMLISLNVVKEKIKNQMAFLKIVNDHNVKKKISEIEIYGKMTPIYVGKIAPYCDHKEGIYISYDKEDDMFKCIFRILKNIVYKHLNNLNY